jgi:hypothetical protein
MIKTFFFIVKQDISKVWGKFKQNLPVCIRNFLIKDLSIFRFSNFSQYGYTREKNTIIIFLKECKTFQRFGESLIKIGPFVFEIFSYEICEYFGFVIFHGC